MLPDNALAEEDDVIKRTQISRDRMPDVIEGDVGNALPPANEDVGPSSSSLSSDSARFIDCWIATLERGSPTESLFYGYRLLRSQPFPNRPQCSIFDRVMMRNDVMLYVDSATADSSVIGPDFNPPRLPMGLSFPEKGEGGHIRRNIRITAVW